MVRSGPFLDIFEGTFYRTIEVQWKKEEARMRLNDLA